MKVIPTPRRLRLLVYLVLLLFSLGACSEEPKKEPHMVIETVGAVERNEFHSIHSSLYHVSLSNKPNSVDVIIRVYLITENRRREINTLFVTSLRVKELYFAIDTPAESYAVERFGDFGVPMLYSTETNFLESPDGNDKTNMEVAESYITRMLSERFDADKNGEINEVPFFQLMGHLKNRSESEGERLEPSTWKLKELLDTETVEEGDYRVVATISWKKASRRLRAKMRGKRTE